MCVSVSLVCVRVTSACGTHSQSRCYAGGFLPVSGLVPVCCVDFYPPPCQALYSLPPHSPSQREGAGMAVIRASHASTGGQLTQFPPQRSLSFCPASPSSITLHRPTSLLILVPRPTGPAAEDESAESADEAPSNDPSHANKGSHSSHTEL